MPPPVFTRSPFVRTLIAALALVGPAAAVQATWSIVLVDTRTGEVALGSATCLTGFNLRDNTPVLLTGVGGATAQSQVDTNGVNRAFIRDGLLSAIAPTQILDGLRTFDATNHQRRQYGMADVLGRTLTFSGTFNGPFAGGQTGRVGDIVYAIQGNVITGPCMVQAAVDAVVNTPGDLAEKLMAGMEAARATGGDGRCSCQPDGADACGCPPANSFVRSSYIAYMLIARAGDIDGCNGIYRAGTATGALALADVTADGRVDVLSCNPTSNNLALLRNTTIPFAPAPTIGQLTSSSAAALPQAVTVADIDSDGRPDALVGSSGNGVLSYFRNPGNGTFSPRVDVGGIAGIRNILPGNYDGSGRASVAALAAAANSVAFLRNTGGAFAAPVFTSLGAGAGASAMVSADLDRNGTLDLVVALGSRNALAVLSGQGDGSFTRLADIATSAAPSQLVTGDFDRDGAADLAVVLSNRTVRTLLRRGETYEVRSLALPNVPARLITADVTGDGALDLLTLNGAALQVLTNDGQGTFSLGPSTSLNANGNDLVAADLDNPRDGLPDLAVSSTLGVLLLKNTGGLGPGGQGVGPRFASGPGCATGNYWMNFNVANAQAIDPDPVFSLRAQFDEWRAAKLGRPDAVRSTAVFNRRCLPADGSSVAVLTIDSRDHTGLRSSAPITSVRIEHARNSDRLVAIGTPTINPDGTIAVALTAPSFRTGIDRLLVTLNDDDRPVVLMPAPSLLVGLDADYDRNGVVEPADLAAYIADYFTDPAPLRTSVAPGLGTPCPDLQAPEDAGFRADFNRDCFPPDQEDLGAFITAYLDACS